MNYKALAGFIMTALIVGVAVIFLDMLIWYVATTFQP